MNASELADTLKEKPALLSLLYDLDLLPEQVTPGSSPWLNMQMIVEAWVKNDAREYVCAKCGRRDESHCEKSDADF